MASLLAMQVEKHYYIRKNGSGLYVFQLSISYFAKAKKAIFRRIFLVYTDMGIIKYKARASLERVMLFYDMRKRAEAQVPVSKTNRIHVTRAIQKGFCCSMA
jgi:hypothetical protein